MFSGKLVLPVACTPVIAKQRVCPSAKEVPWLPFCTSIVNAHGQSSFIFPLQIALQNQLGPCHVINAKWFSTSEVILSTFHRLIAYAICIPFCTGIYVHLNAKWFFKAEVILSMKFGIACTVACMVACTSESSARELPFGTAVNVHLNVG